MSHFTTLWKDGVRYRLPLYQYVEGQGGRLDKTATLEHLKLATLTRMYEGEPELMPMAFGPDGLSRDLFQHNSIIEVSGQAAAAVQPGAAPPGAAAAPAAAAAATATVAAAEQTYQEWLAKLDSPSSAAKAGHKFILQQQQPASQPGDCGPKILNHRPQTATSTLPVALVYPRMGELADQLRTDSTHQPPSRRDIQFGLSLCHDMSAAFDTEEKRTEAVQALLRAYLGDAFQIVVAKRGEQCADLTITHSSLPDSFPLALCEVKNEPGQAGDSWLQSSLYYAGLVREQQRKHQGQAFAWPVLLLEVVGPLLRISALVFTTRVVCEPLTPLLNLLDLHLHQPDQVMAVVRAMAAFRCTLHSMAQDAAHGGLPPVRCITSMAPRHASLPLPCHLAQHVAGSGAVRVKELVPGSSRLLFLVEEGPEVEGHTRYLVKYTRSYGTSVHRAWAAAGLAPQLLRLELLPGGWLAVTLQYLALEDGWVGLNAMLECRLRGGSTQQARVGEGRQPQQRTAQPPSVPAAGSSQRAGPAAAMSVAEVRAQCRALTQDEWADLFAHIEGQVRHAHAVRVPVDNGGAGANAGAPVHSAQAQAPHAAASSAATAAAAAAATAAPSSPGGCGVHGDMRPPNILLQLEPGGTLAATTPKVMVIDFDWAGVEGTARYPPFISNRVRWPAGVQPGELLDHTHDVALLRAELEPTSGHTYSWAADSSEPTLEEALVEQLGLGR